MTAWAVLVTSVCVAAGVVYLVRCDPLLRTGISLVYGAWHLPLLLATALPFRAAYEPSPISWVGVGLLLAVHAACLALAGGFRLRRGLRRPQVGFPAPREFIFWIACSAPFLLVLDLLVFRGAHFGSNLAANRTEVSGSKTIAGQLGAVASGFGLYLLLSAFPRGERRVRWKYVAPYVVVSAIGLVSGNRQYFFIGLLLLLLCFALSRDVPLKKLLARGPLVIVLFAALGVAFTLVRQSATAGRQDTFLESIGSISVDPSAPGIVKHSYDVRTAALTVFYYYGTEYAVATRLWDSYTPDAPKGSMTLPALYRRWSGLLGDPSQEDVDNAVHAQMAQRLNVFYPRIWPTMFADVLFEWGRRGVVAFAALLTLLGLALGLRHGAGRGSMAAATFLACMAFGVMYIPTYEVPVVGLVLAGLASGFGRWASRVALGGTRRGARLGGRAEPMRWGAT